MQTVLVPGLLCSARLYGRVLPAVWRHGSVTIADTRRDDTIPAIAARLLAEAPERFALVGLSMGGYVALEVMRQAPGRVAALALISTSARPDTPEQRAARREQLAAVRDGRFDELVERVFPVLVDEGAREDEDLRAAWRAMAREVGPDAFARQLEACIARADARPLLDAIGCPAAVVHGTGDGLIPIENGEELAAGIPGARFTRVERCGHMSALERPAEVAAALERLLQGAWRPGEDTDT